ncbi:MAG: hypothetical protein ACYDCL_02525 [Myxococcales bacterium]
MRLLRRSCLVALALAAGSARAQDPFEIQVYDAQVLGYGEAMEELHVISKPSVTVPPPGAPRDPGLFHLAAEPQLGLGRHLETAFYVESSLWPDGSLHVSGGKLRLKWKLWFSDDWPVQLAVNGEVGNVDPNSDVYVWSGEIRPILEMHPFGRCRLFVNPSVDVPLGHDWRVGPQFEPQGKLNCEVLWGIAPGVEYYSGLGPLVDWLPLPQESHYLFYTLDVYRWPKVEINVGLGQPLTLASGPWTLNANLGLELP